MYIVITGSSRGIGLELTKIALKEGHHVLGVARHPEESHELMELKNKMPKLKLLKLDILTKDAPEKIRSAAEEWPHVDLLINNAGVLFEEDNQENFEKSFLTNSIKPFLITRALFDKLKKSHRPVSLQITSQMGSIQLSSGGHYSYRASKTALNMIFKSLAVDENWLICLQVHPGWVRTRMGGDSAPTAPEESAAGIWKTFIDASLKQSGSFQDFRGTPLPW